MMLAGFLPLPAVAADGVEVLLDGDEPQVWSGMVRPTTEIKRDGESSYELYGPYQTGLKAVEPIPVHADRRYELSAWMRSLDAETPASAFMGLHMLDEEKRPITIKNVKVYPGTETVLAEDAHAGATEITVVRNDAWLKYKHVAVAFHVAADYSDLPNRTVSPKIKAVHEEDERPRPAFLSELEQSAVDRETSSTITSVREKEDRLRVVFLSGLKQSYPAGTSVRLHLPWGAPFYWAAKGWIPASWTRYSAVLEGWARLGTPADRFWRGTAYVQPFVWFGNYNKTPAEEARLYVETIRFTSRPGSLATIRGRVRWPEIWRVYGPFAGDEAQSLDVFRERPDEVALGERRIEARLLPSPEGLRFDFGEIYEGFGFRDVAWLVGVVDVPEGGPVTFGMGADWWMQAWVDDRPLIDTSEQGNGAWPPSADDFRQTIRLEAGPHVLAIRFKSGKGSSVLVLAGPAELRDLFTAGVQDGDVSKASIKAAVRSERAKGFWTNPRAPSSRIARASSPTLKPLASSTRTSGSIALRALNVSRPSSFGMMRSRITRSISRQCSSK